MTSKNPFEDFINEELEKMDEFSGEVSPIESQPAEQAQPAEQGDGKIEITVEYREEINSGRIYSMMYETKHAPKINPIRPAGRHKGGGQFQINIPLEDFVNEYTGQLVHREVLHEKESKIFQETPSEARVHIHTYLDEAREKAPLYRQLNGIMEYLVELHKE